jgi:hypothetical protein
MDLLSFLNLKERKYAVPNDGRMEAYERAGAAHVALECAAFVREALDLVEVIRHGPFVADLEALLGVSPFSVHLSTVLRDVAPPRWRPILADLKRLARMTQGWNEEGRP